MFWHRVFDCNCFPTAFFFFFFAEESIYLSYTHTRSESGHFGFSLGHSIVQSLFCYQPIALLDLILLLISAYCWMLLWLRKCLVAVEVFLRFSLLFLLLGSLVESGDWRWCEHVLRCKVNEACAFELSSIVIHYYVKNPLLGKIPFSLSITLALVNGSKWAISV